MNQSYWVSKHFLCQHKAIHQFSVIGSGSQPKRIEGLEFYWNSGVQIVSKAWWINLDSRRSKIRFTTTSRNKDGNRKTLVKKTWTYLSFVELSVKCSIQNRLLEYGSKVWAIYLTYFAICLTIPGQFQVTSSLAWYHWGQHSQQSWGLSPACFRADMAIV